MHIWRIGCLTLFWLAGSACDSELGNKSSGQACTRSAQCAEGLRCRDGLCRSTKDDEHAGARDAGADVDAQPDAMQLDDVSRK